jgi:TRAP-type mannitol/chloroaromatic compound transport system substrate-binding protein
MSPRSRFFGWSHFLRRTGNSGGNELMNEFYKTHNLYGLPSGNTNCQMGGWFRREIKEVADLNGLKFRIGGFAGQVLSKLGVRRQEPEGRGPRVVVSSRRILA